MSRRLLTLLVLSATLLVAGCGDDAEEGDLTNSVSQEEAVEAQEQNAVELGGLNYRVNLFREINPRIPPDQALYDGPPPEEGEVYFGAFLRVCNESGEEATPTDEITLLDAFGERYPQVGTGADQFGYDPEELTPGECVPLENTATARAVDGAVLVYAIPVDALTNRPFVLEFTAEGENGEQTKQVQLDL